MGMMDKFMNVIRLNADDDDDEIYDDEFYDDDKFKNIRDAFIAGAVWKQMKNER